MEPNDGVESSVNHRPSRGRPPRPPVATGDKDWDTSVAMLRSVRRQTGLTQKQMADQLRVHRTALAAWERSERRPPPVIFDKLDRDFPREFAIAEASVANGGSSRSDVLTLGVVSAVNGVYAESGMRELSILAVRQAMRFVTSDISNLALCTQDLIESYMTDPVNEVFGRLVLLQDWGLRLLGDANSDRVSIRTVLATIEGMLGKACHDMGDLESAQIHLHVAADLAPRNSEMTAWIRILKSLVFYWSRDADGAEASALEAVRLRVPGPVGIWALASLARARALRGDVAGVHALAHQIRRDRRKVEKATSLTGLMDFPIEKQDYYLAEALALASPGARSVVGFATQAVKAYERSSVAPSYSDDAGARSALAVALVKVNEIDKASLALSKVFDIPPAKRIRGIQVCLSTVDGELCRTGAGTEVRKLRAEIAQFLQNCYSVRQEPLTSAARWLLDVRAPATGT